MLDIFKHKNNKRIISNLRSRKYRYLCSKSKTLSVKKIILKLSADTRKIYLSTMTKYLYFATPHLCQASYWLSSNNKMPWK